MDIRDNLKPDHEFYWAEFKVKSLSRQEHDQEHIRIGSDSERKDQNRLYHLLKHAELWLKEGKLSEEETQKYLEMKSKTEFLPES